MKKNVGELRYLQRLNDYELEVEMDILRDGRIHVGVTPGATADDAIEAWEYRNIRGRYLTFAGRPLLVAYVEGRVGDGHNSRTVIDRATGEQYESYTDATAERAVGIVSEDTEDLTLIERDGHIWIRAKGRVWSTYAPELTEKLIRTGRMSVSVETNVLESHVEDGVDVMDDWEGLGVTLLGDGVRPAVPGANIRVMAADVEREFQERKLRVASLVREEINSKPQKIKAQGSELSMDHLSKRELTAYQERFGSDHRVLSGVKVDGGVKLTLLRRKSMDFWAYVLGDGDKEIHPEDFKVCEAELVMRQNGEEIGCADAADVVECELSEICEQAENAAKDLETCKAENERMCQEIADMKARETARRIRASKDAGVKQLEDINRNRETYDRFPDDTIQGLLTAAESGGYVEMYAESGEWNGDERIRNDVMGLCMKQQMEQDKAKAEQRRTSAERHYAFESDGSMAVSDPIAEMYNSMVK